MTQRDIYGGPAEKFLNRIPISPTSKGNENWFEKAKGLRNRGHYKELLSKEIENKFEVFEKSEEKL